MQRTLATAAILPSNGADREVSARGGFLMRMRCALLAVLRA